MRIRDGFVLPPDREREMKRAIRLEWITLFMLATIVVVMYLTMGSSQAMKAAWLEDMLSFVPPIAFLVAARYRRRAPDDRFPYGYQRSVSIAFLAGSVALSFMGLYILYESVSGLLRGHHPTIGTVVLFGRQFWAGWLMIPALIYSAIPPMILGHLKQRPAHALHDKTLVADADMNRADWTTAGAGIAGILGIGIGWWWADGVAAGIIALNITKDGFTNLQRVVADLMDQRPTTVDGEVSDVPVRLENALRGMDWVRAAEVRLREEGHVFVGEAFVEIGVLASDDVAGHLRQAADIARGVDWRIHDIVITVVPAGTLAHDSDTVQPVRPSGRDRADT